MNIIDILKRAAEALERAAAVVIMERDSSEFEREAENLRAAITEMESAKLPEPRLSDFFFSANPEPTNYYTRDQMLAFRAAGRAPLTEQAIWDAVGHGVVGGIGLPSKAVAVARAIERAHGIKEATNV